MRARTERQAERERRESQAIARLAAGHELAVVALKAVPPHLERRTIRHLGAEAESPRQRKPEHTSQHAPRLERVARDELAANSQLQSEPVVLARRRRLRAEALGGRRDHTRSE